MKKLIVFDLDGTLAPSKSALAAETAGLLRALLSVVKVAVISGGAWPQFEEQLLAEIPHDDCLVNLLLLPACGTQFYRYNGEWEQVYAEELTAGQKEKIFAALTSALQMAGLRADKVWGEMIEDRGSQITFSALGQQAPLAEKQRWDADFIKRKKIAAILDPLLPEFSIRLGGATSIDITQAGIDKAYGIGKLREILHISLEEMIFVGDALFPGGNDYPVEQAGVVSIRVGGPADTNLVIRTILACFSNHQNTQAKAGGADAGKGTE